MTSRKIGTLRESSLHAALKEWYVQPGDFIERVVGGYVIDIVRGDLLVEIQTGNFSSLREKLKVLLPEHQVRLVYPIAQEKWVCRKMPDGRLLGRRKSPRHGRIEDLFVELSRIVKPAMHPNFSLEVLMVHSEDVWTDDGRGSWRRRGWSLSDRNLLTVQSREAFACPKDYLRLLPDLAEPFLTQDLAQALRVSRAGAQKMAYCLREMGLIRVVGKQRNALLYSILFK